MEIVLAHNNMDFDSLAAEYAVTKLHPGTRMIPGHPLTGHIRRFLSLYRDSLPLAELQYLDLSKVKHVYLVDTQSPDRLDETARDLIIQRRCSYTIYDHHALDPEGLGPGARKDSIIRPAGAATSLVVNELIARKEPLSPFEATLLAIGIYEDTGCLTYRGTTELDALCVAHLLKSGADLTQVEHFINPKLTEQQALLLQKLVRNSSELSVSGVRVVIAHATWERYLEGLATLTRRLLELGSADAAVTIVHMRDRVHIVARSDTAAIDARTIAQRFGGDGHPGASSAVSKRAIADIIREVEELLRTTTRPEPLASDIMTSPVRTIRQTTSMDEAHRIMLRYGEDGLIVVEGDRVEGVVSRRDVDKAVHHKLSHAPVRGFMSRPVLTITPDTTLSEIQQIMVKEDIGRLPVLSEERRLVGLVTRRDVLRTVYGTGETLAGVDRVQPLREHHHLKEKLEHIDPATRWLFNQLGAAAERRRMNVYAVGGCVRDLLLGLPTFDLDFVVEGSAIELAEALEQSYPGRFEVVARHDRFQTATVMFYGAEKREVDLSTARAEYYEYPAALPTVEPSSLAQDLFRRDFSINALAVCLNSDSFGDVVDYFNGLNDLRDGLIRVLHQFSFIEDPTRIVRAARFAARFAFELEPRTRHQAERSIEMGIFDDLGGVRLKQELRLILESPQRLKALDLLGELGGGLRFLDAQLQYDADARRHLRIAERLAQRYQIGHEWVVYLGLLLSKLEPQHLDEVMDRLYIGNDEKEWIRRGVRLAGDLGALEGDLRPSEVDRLLHGVKEQSLAIAAALGKPGSRVRRAILLYLRELRHVRVTTSGDDLIRMGVPEGPRVGQVLSELRAARLDGQIKSWQDEMNFIKRLHAGRT